MDLERNAPPKPARGSHADVRKDRKRTRVTFETTEKKHVRKRDSGMCRWPRCTYRDEPVEAAHITGKGMGGTPSGERNRRGNLILLCRKHHQHDRSPSNPLGSLERNDLRIIPLTPAGAEGPCSFWAKDTDDGPLYCVAQETAIRQYERD